MSSSLHSSSSSSAHSDSLSTYSSASSFCSASSGISSSSSSSSSSTNSSSNLLVFCKNCREPLSAACLAEGNHQKHKFLSLQDAVVSQTEKLSRDSKHLKNIYKTCKNIKPKTSKARKQCNDTYEKVTETIDGLYQDLWALLSQNQMQALNLLDAERETLNKSLSQFEYQDTLTDIQETIQQLENQHTMEQQTQLDDIKKLQERLEDMEKLFSALTEETECDDNAQKMFDGTRIRALEESVKIIFQKITELLPQPWEISDAITFDKGKKHNALTFCEKRMQLFLQNSTSTQTNRHTETWCSAVADKSFNTGQHYWEVEVEGSQSWSVGIVYEDWLKNKENQLNHPLGRDCSSWALECDEGDLVALHSDEVSAVKSCSVSRLGVCVDYDKGKLKFYDVNSAKCLHVTGFDPSKPVHPAFSLRKTGLKKTSSLTICKLFPSSENRYLEDNEEEEDTSRNNLRTSADDQVSDLADSVQSLTPN
ncbi:zinc finger protein RFP [Astyanax mexicanus]|uniref:Zinc finger protein RFP-like n=1 Tax=Astyanax mexicanus TaxID=7994 RepID=W5JYX5_ASTMX|nr:zinc finger protein RFP [Astyanax mexicanus]